MSEDVESPVAPPRQGPMRRLWGRFLKARSSRLGLVLVAAFTLVAFFAPFLAHRLPLYWRDNATGLTTYPLLREFLAPSDTTEPVLEKGINFLMLFLPAALLAWRLMNRAAPRLARVESKFVSLLFGALFSATLWFSLGGMVVEGGGRDWLHYEDPPVPEMDDIANPLRVYDEPASSGAVRAKIKARLLESGLPPRDAVNVDAREKLTPEMEDTVRRAIVSALQKTIEGPVVIPPSEANLEGSRIPDITDASIAVGINGARWNRVLVEAAYPGLLNPMRNARVTFVTLAAVCLLVLVGLTVIFMAGANQFALSPRWLVLLLLAAVMAVPFLRTPRHDHTQYRALAAEGKGTGLFPPIPYGPNEQGFGPRLPPSWLEESPGFTAESVLSWDILEKELAHPSRDETRLVSDKLTAAFPDWREAMRGEPGRERVLAALNGLVADSSLAAAVDPDAMRGDLNFNPYLAEIRSGRALAPPHGERFNRLLIEKAAPNAFRPVSAVRWKKPNHAAGTHFFGTDESGRDVLVRIIHGARVSLSVGFVSVFLATVIGLVMGSLAAYYGGWVDMAISRFLEIMICFPSFFLILAVIAVLDKRSIINIMLVIGLTSWTGVARLIRGEMLRQKKMDYVSASIALGAPDTRTIFRHILPNAMAPVLVSISFGITGAILTEAGLSFIGFGVTPPTPTWGQLLSETRESPLANWWLAVFPGVVLFLSVLAYNMVGEALRDALDPRTSL